ncbi:extracellular solute-binding protein [Microbacterium immunditiarum]|uniref:Multiple sugar transport system substrate-binding protein n=1 Tax=Microbacterium immunditiarum TaxID=337480 RepID=A0A7Y9GMQ2_9MICO|nr:extracellular solute-binding protein [Microbacterium immunditiarum]NYE18200.1 multiple sugar transport system substrate-binding protein [Microbacterium immunditiarum]
MTRITRAAAAAAVGSVLAIAIGGCSAAGGVPQGTEDDPITITFWGSYGNGGNSAQQEVLDKTLIPSFEESHPGVEVKYVDVPYDDLLQKLTTSAAGDELPDLVRADLGWVPRFADLGVLVPLSDVMDDFDELADATYPGVLATNLFDGKYYGLPLDTNTRVQITEPGALATAGVDTPPATFEEFVALGEALEGTGVTLFADGGLGAWNIMPWIWSGGGDIADEDLTASTGVLDSDENIATIQMLVDLFDSGQVSSGIIGNEGAVSTSEGLPNGDYATILDGPWMTGIWADQFPGFEPVYSPVPAGPGGSISVVGGEDIVLTASSQHQEAALEFIRFTQSEEFQLALVPTGQLTVVEALGPKQVELVPGLEVFTAQLETAKNRLAITQGAEVDTILNEELTPAFEGTVSVREALSAAAARIDELLAG